MQYIFNEEDYEYEPPEEYESDREKTSREKLEQARDFFRGILDVMQGREAFDEGNMYRYLQETCSALDIEYEDAELCVQDRPQMTEYLSRWIEFNNAYLKDLVR